MSVSAYELAYVAAQAADDKQADNIVLLDLTEVSDLCEYMLICSADNPNKVKSIVDEIEEKIRFNCSEKPLGTEGKLDNTWILLDYGSVIVNVFDEEERDIYRLENLWGDARRVELNFED